MPGGNGTGPMGMGPMTGRGMGYCAGYVKPGFGWGGGFGRGLGMRRGGRTGAPRYMGAGFSAVPPVSGSTREQELDALKMQADDYKAALENIEARIAGLEKDQ